MKKGFTLIELLIVIVIIGILAAVVTTNFVAARSRAQDSQKKSNLQQLKIALRSYYVNHKSFPASTNGLTLFGCGANGTSQCGDSFTEGNIEYMSKFAKSGNFYEFRYYTCNGTDDFRIKVSLNNSSDPDIAESQLKCPVCGTTYSVNDYILCSN